MTPSQFNFDDICFSAANISLNWPLPAKSPGKTLLLYYFEYNVETRHYISIILRCFFINVPGISSLDFYFESLVNRFIDF